MITGIRRCGKSVLLLELFYEYLLNHEVEEVFIDEVQFTIKVVDKENGGIEVSIYDMLNELKSYKNLDVYVTGSNSRMLSMLYGGMPRLVSISDETEKKAYLSRLYEELYVKDIVERNKLEREDILNASL